MNRQALTIPSAAKPRTPACSTVKKPCSSVSTKSAVRKKQKSLIYQNSFSSFQYARTANQTMTAKMTYAMSVALSDIKVMLAGLLRQMNKFSTLKKMTPRSRESRGVRVRSVVTVPNRMDDAASRDKLTLPAAQFQSHPHVSPGFASFTHETRRRGGNSPTFGAPTARVAVMGARDNQDYKCRLGSYSQSPKGQNVGQASDPRYGYPGYTANMTPQIALPSAGRDSGAGAMTKGTGT